MTRGASDRRCRLSAAIREWEVQFTPAPFLDPWHADAQFTGVQVRLRASHVQGDIQADHASKSTETTFDEVKGRPVGAARFVGQLLTNNHQAPVLAKHPQGISSHTGHVDEHFHGSGRFHHIECRGVEGRHPLRAGIVAAVEFLEHASNLVRQFLGVGE